MQINGRVFCSLASVRPPGTTKDHQTDQIRYTEVSQVRRNFKGTSYMELLKRHVYKNLNM